MFSSITQIHYSGMYLLLSHSNHCFEEFDKVSTLVVIWSRGQIMTLQACFENLLYMINGQLWFS